MRVATDYDNHQALICGNSSLTYAELRQRIEDKVELLHTNLLKGIKVAIDLPDSYTYIEWVFANWSVHNTIMVLEQRLTQEEKNQRLALFQPDILIQEYASTASKLVSFKPDLLTSLVDYPKSDVTIKMQGEALILFSSGSTGLPKMIRRSYATLMNEMEQYGKEPGAPNSSSQVLCLVPITHSFGLISAVLHTLRSGGTLVFSEIVKPQQWLGLMREHPITHVYGVAFHYQLLAKALASYRESLSRRPSLLSSGGPLPSSLIDQFRTEFGFTLSQQYGMSETGYLAVDFIGSRAGSTGRMAEHISWECEENSQLSIIMSSSPYLQPHSNWVDRDEIHTGLLYTQDNVRIDEDGYLFILSRGNDIVSVGGFKVSLQEIEDEIRQHDHVRDCSCIAHEHEVFGIVLEAFVEWNELGAVAFADLAAWLRKSLSAYKIPRSFQMIDQIPVSPSGKVLKGELLKKENLKI